MPALGNRRTVSPAKIRRRAAQPAPRIKNVPGVHVAPQSHAPPRHSAPPPKWKSLSTGAPGSQRGRKAFPGPSVGGEPRFQSQRVTAGRRQRRAQRALPAPVVPHIPLIEHPTRQQTAAAIQLGRRTQGASPTRAREIATDPRLRQYRALLNYYQTGQGLRELAAEGRRVGTTGKPAETLSERGGTERQNPLTPYSAAVIGALTPALQTPGSKVTARKMPARKKTQVAGIDVGAIKSAIGSIAPGLATLGKTIHPEVSLGDFGDKVTRDIKTGVTAPFIGGYEFWNAVAKSYQKHDPQPLEQFGSQTAKAFSEGAGGKLLKGDVGGALKYIGEHPVLGPLEVAPLVGVPGRVAGAAARLARLGEVGDTALTRAVARVRSPVALNPTEAGTARRFYNQPKASNDLIRGLIQQALDKRRPIVKDAEGKPLILHRGRGKGPKTVPVRAARPNEAERLQQRRGNFESAGQAAESRRIREKTRPRELRGVAPLHSKLERELVQPAGEGYILSTRTWDANVAKRVAEIKEALADPELDKIDRKAAEANLKKWEAAEHLSPEGRARVIAAAEARGRDLFNPLDKELADAKYAPSHRLERSRLSVAGLAHHEGARYGEAVTSEAKAEFEAARGELKAANREVNQARDAVRVAQRRHDRAQAHTTRPGRQVKQRRLSDKELESALRERDKLVKVTEDGGKLTASQRRRRAVLEDKINNRDGAKGVGPSAAARRDKAAADHAARELEDAQKRLKEAEDRADKIEVPRKPRKQTTLVDKEGNYLHNQTIRETIEKAGRDPDTVHYLPHRVDDTLKRSYYRAIRPSERPGALAGTREGIIQKRGSGAMSEQIAVDELTNKRVTLATIRRYDRLGHEAGVSMPAFKAALEKERTGGQLTRGERELIEHEGHGTFNEASNAARDLKREGKGEFVVWKITGPRMSEQDAADLGSQLDVHMMETLQNGMLKQRAVDDGTGGRNYVLMPKAFVQRMLDQTAPASDFIRVGQMLNVPFRMAVLPQLRWLTGNFIEPYFIRLPLEGSGAINIPGMLNDIVQGKRILKHMEAHPNREVKRAAQTLRALFGEGMFIGGPQSSIRTRSEDLPGFLGRAMAKAEIPFHRWPAFNYFGKALLAFPKAFFWFNRHFIENPAQMASFGKSARRQLQEFGTQWQKTFVLGKQALDDVSHGLTDTAAQHRFLKEQHVLLGQYDAFGPSVRHAVQSYTPFLPWTLASMRFVYWTFPVHKTNSFVAMLNAGKSVLPDWEKEHKDTPPGTLRYGIKSKGGWVDAARYTPFGVSIPLEEEGPNNIIQQFLPQLKGAINALQGQDPFERDLELPGKRKPSPQDRELIALYQLLTSFMPGINTAQGLLQEGGTGYSNSTFWDPKVKPGTSFQSALNRTLNPFRPIYLKQPQHSGPLSAHEEAVLEHEAERAERAGGGLSLAQEAQLEREAEEAERKAP